MRLTYNLIYVCNRLTWHADSPKPTCLRFGVFGIGSHDALNIKNPTCLLPFPARCERLAVAKALCPVSKDGIHAHSWCTSEMACWPHGGVACIRSLHKTRQVRLYVCNVHKLVNLFAGCRHREAELGWNSFGLEDWAGWYVRGKPKKTRTSPKLEHGVHVKAQVFQSFCVFVCVLFLCLRQCLSLLRYMYV